MTMETVVFEVTSVLHRQDGFTRLLGWLDSRADEVKICGWDGALDEARAGQWREAEGYWSEHPVYGLRFVARASRRSLPSQAASIEGLAKLFKQLPGVGEKKALEMAARGLQAFIAEPELVTSYAGKAYREKALKAWCEMAPSSRLTSLLGEMGFSMREQNRLIEQCGGEEGTWVVLREDAFSLVGKVPGASFQRMDRLAERLGMPVDSPGRLRKGAAHVAREASQRGGHTALEIDAVVRAAVELLGTGDHALAPELVREAAIRSDDLQRVGSSRIGLATLVTAERAIAENLEHFRNFDGLGIEPELIAACARERKLDETQTRALQVLAKSPVAALVGGPGTGKTTTLGALFQAARREGLRIWALAPTGLAARRLGAQAGQEGHTIHRFVGMLSKEATGGVDGVVVDEASMMDSEICSSLLRALRNVCPRILLVGDPHQLPPVSPGKPFRDILNSGVVPVCRLDKIYRQEHQPVIPIIAAKVREGEYPPGGTDIGYRRDDCADAAEVERIAVASALDQVARFQSQNTAVLAPIYKGAGGVDALGRALQQALNPNHSDPAQALSGPRGRLAVGDPVMHTRNDYDQGLLHAFTGTVLSVRRNADRVEIAWEDGNCRWHEAVDGKVKNVVLAYALSWHRSQGSEWRAVTVVVTRGAYPVLSREALYTALTRAKDEVRLVVEQGPAARTSALRFALREGSRRETVLDELLANLSPRAVAV